MPERSNPVTPNNSQENHRRLLEQDDEVKSNSVEKVCMSYKESVQCTLKLINNALKKSLENNYGSLQVLFDKIESYTSKIDQNSNCNLALQAAHTCSEKIEKIEEFEDIKLNLKENVQKIVEKLEKIEALHKRLLRNLLTNENKPEVERFRTIETHKGTFDKIIMCKNFEESDTSVQNQQQPPEQPLKTDSEVIPDIQRRKPFEDLHMKLIQQLEATDSLEGFIKLMQKTPPAANNAPTKGSRKRRATSAATSESSDGKSLDKERSFIQKYNGSLWFFPCKNSKYRKIYEDKISLSTKSSRSRKSTASTTMANVTKKKPVQKRVAKSSCTIQSTQSPTQEQPPRTTKIEREKLKYYDILDDIATKDLEPLKAEYPRKDNIPEVRSASSYLERMLSENDKVWRQLLQPPTFKSQKKKIKNKNVQKLMDYLTEPQRFYNHQQKMIVMPVKCYYDNVPTRELPLQIDDATSELSNFKENCEAAVNALKDSVLEYRENKITSFITDLTRTPEDCPQTSPPMNGQLAKKTPRTELGGIGPLKSRPSTPFSASKNSLGSGGKAPLNVQRNKDMLEHLRGLKLKNDNIQKNIQKAIDVIESKMIDILSSPSSSNSTEAFHAMEEEITKVLKMMNNNNNNNNNNSESDEKTSEEKLKQQKFLHQNLMAGNGNGNGGSIKLSAKILVQQLEKIEPEKDENHVKSSSGAQQQQQQQQQQHQITNNNRDEVMMGVGYKDKINGRANNRNLNGILDFVPGVDLVPNSINKTEPIADSEIITGTTNKEKQKSPPPESNNKKILLSKQEVALNIQEVIQNSAKATRDVTPRKKLDLNINGKGDRPLIVAADKEKEGLKESDIKEALKEIVKLDQTPYKTKISKKRGSAGGDKKSPLRGGKNHQSPKQPAAPVQPQQINHQSPKQSPAAAQEAVVQQPTHPPQMNMEESEKLLGQVDHVVQKIDTIYQKFYDENKKSPGRNHGHHHHNDKKIPNNNNNNKEVQDREVISFLDKVEKAGWEKVASVKHKQIEGVMQVYERARSCALARMYHVVKIEKEPMTNVESPTKPKVIELVSNEAEGTAKRAEISKSQDHLEKNVDKIGDFGQEQLHEVGNKSRRLEENLETLAQSKDVTNNSEKKLDNLGANDAKIPHSTDFKIDQPERTQPANTKDQISTKDATNLVNDESLGKKTSNKECLAAKVLSNKCLGKDVSDKECMARSLSDKGCCAKRPSILDQSSLITNSFYDVAKKLSEPDNSFETKPSIDEDFSVNHNVFSKESIEDGVIEADLQSFGDLQQPNTSSSSEDEECLTEISLSGGEDPYPDPKIGEQPDSEMDCAMSKHCYMMEQCLEEQCLELAQISHHLNVCQKKNRGGFIVDRSDQDQDCRDFELIERYQRRRESALKLFYFFFYSALLVALSLDYTC